MLLPEFHLEIFQELKQGLGRYLNISLLILWKSRFIDSRRLLGSFHLSVVEMQLLIEFVMFLQELHVLLDLPFFLPFVEVVHHVRLVHLLKRVFYLWSFWQNVQRQSHWDGIRILGLKCSKLAFVGAWLRWGDVTDLQTFWWLVNVNGTWCVDRSFCWVLSHRLDLCKERNLKLRASFRVLNHPIVDHHVNFIAKIAEHVPQRPRFKLELMVQPNVCVE